MAEDLCAPGLADEIIVVQNAAVRLELAACFEGNDEVLVTQTDQLSQVAVTGYCGVKFEGHWSILP